MGTTSKIVQQAYEAFGRRDIPGLLELVSDSVDWEFVGPKSLPYTGKRTNRSGVGDFFAAVDRSEEIHAFEPREFIEAGEHLTVLGWERTTARDTGKQYETDWVHVFTVKAGKITRWRGFMNTAARYAV